MIEDGDFSSEEPSRAQSPDAAALHFALNAAAGSTEARAYLAKQGEVAAEQAKLVALQAEQLREEMQLNVSHLKFRRYSDFTKSAFEVAVGLVVLLAVCGLGAMVWNATRDHDLVVEAFSVPPDVAQTGLTGAVLAGRVLDKFGQMQARTRASTQAAVGYRADRADAVRVEIPDTGVSLSEINLYLRAWLGSETRVSGDLVHTPNGLAITTRAGGSPGATVEGKTDALDSLIEKSAERIFAVALPYRYVEYLVQKRRFAEANALAPALAAQGSPQNRALANSAWAKLLFFQGDMHRALLKGREAVRLDPESAPSRGWLSIAEADLGHEEASFIHTDALLTLVQNAPVDGWKPQIIFTIYQDELTGDLADAERMWVVRSDQVPLPANDLQSATADAADDHDIAAARRYAEAVPPKDAQGRPEVNVPTSFIYVDLAREDWQGAVKNGRASEAVANAQSDQNWQLLLIMPAFVDALARSGNVAEAERVASQMPSDCDSCMRARGRLAAMVGHEAEAANDFAVVAARSPHEPYAETDWGQTLLARGQYDAAIAKFQEANVKGPHFADPIEMWGEALMQKNRSDLALAKFAEADKYAPNWGRLHIKWGEALFYAGQHDAAKKQFALAGGLELSQSDKAALAAWTKAHG